MSEIDLFNINIDALFEQYTINEIIEIHKKIQAELDKKKQELRFMVGERYRDVITAADAIKSMQYSAENLYTHIGDINDKCHILQSSINVDDTKPIIVDKLKNFYRSVAVQIKILISIPEYIWVSLDNGDFLKAVHLYLLAIHIYTGLELDTEHKIAETFTILSRLKLSINSFRNRILDGIRKRLQAVNLNSEEASNHLCAYMLLENKSQEFVITKFIEMRQIALHNLLESDISVHSVVRVQIINIMNCLICSILLIHSCFIDYKKMSDGLVQITMKQLLSPETEKVIKLVDLEASPLLNYLPSLVKEFRPSCTEGQTSLTKEIVQRTISSWLQSTSNVLNSNLSKSLELITTVKVLQTIREEAFKLENLDNWENICNDSYLPEKFTVWNYFFQPLVSKRAEKLICYKIEDSLKYLYKKYDNVFQLSNNHERSEKDLRWYVWNEEPNDLSKDKVEHPGLAMKTKGHSQKVVSLCQSMDGKYLELIQDVNIYLYGSEHKNAKKTKSNFTNVEYDLERKHLQEHVRKETYQSINKLISYTENFINSETDVTLKVTKSVMAARLLQAVPQLCPNLIKTCSYGDYPNDWDTVHTLFVNKNIQFWTDWLNVTKEHIQNILMNFLTDLHYNTMLEILPRWNTIEIEEQTEDRIFNSQIRIPSQPSVCLMDVLTEISGELNGILPHTLPKIIHGQFIEILAESILQRYETLTENNDDAFNQNMAMQFLLDVKFLTTICVKRDNKELMKKSQQICDMLRAKIDPFDLDVFYPYLQTNIKRSVIQSQMFLGCFLPASAQLASLGSVESKAIDNEPCVIALSTPTTEQWFPLLPVTAPLTKTITIPTVPTTLATTISSLSLSSPSKTTTMQHQKTSQSKRELTVKEKTDTAETSTSTSSSTFVRSGAAALFGAMTNDWFS